MERTELCQAGEPIWLNKRRLSEYDAQRRTRPNFQFSLQSLHGLQHLNFRITSVHPFTDFIRRRKGQGQCGHYENVCLRINLPHKCTSKTFSFYEPVVFLFSRKSTDAMPGHTNTANLMLMLKFTKHKIMFCCTQLDAALVRGENCSHDVSTVQWCFTSRENGSLFSFSLSFAHNNQLDGIDTLECLHRAHHKTLINIANEIENGICVYGREALFYAPNIILDVLRAINLKLYEQQTSATTMEWVFICGKPHSIGPTAVVCSIDALIVSAMQRGRTKKKHCCFSFALLHSEHSLLLSKLRTVRYAVRLAYIYFYQLSVDLIWFVGRYISCGYSQNVQYLIKVALNSSLNGFDLTKINELFHFSLCMISASALIFFLIFLKIATRRITCCCCSGCSARKKKLWRMLSVSPIGFINDLVY